MPTSLRFPKPSACQVLQAPWAVCQLRGDPSKKEVRHRVSIAELDYGCLAASVFGNAELPEALRMTLVRTRIDSKLFVSAGTWPQLPHGPLHSLGIPRLKALRQIAQSFRGCSGAMSDAELFQKLRLPAACTLWCRPADACLLLASPGSGIPPCFPSSRTVRLLGGPPC